jgi:ribonucleoside-diphosphate reductase alpha chain
MFVTKRDGTQEHVSFDKVLNRISILCANPTRLNASVSPYEVAQKVCSRIYNGVLTSQLDELAAQLCSSMMIDEPDYGKLASRIIVSNHHKNTLDSFVENVKRLHANPIKLVDDEIYRLVVEDEGGDGVADRIEKALDYSRDYDFDYFGFSTLEKSYLLRIDGRVVERPQQLFMRVALGIHGSDVDRAIETYDLMSRRMFVHATPTLFNAGTPHPQNSSCYLVNLESDSITGIYNTLGECAQISKYAGGIGMHVHHVRSKNSTIRGTNGRSTGIIPMLRVFNATARYVNQSGRRNGSIAVFLEPWHADVESFLELRKNTGNEDDRTRDLFTSMWIPDLFMERVISDQTWSLMCPDACPGLSDVHGEAFERLYVEYESSGRFVKRLPAKDIWFRILESQIETGTPYIGFKDHVNAKSNQMNVGTIKSSNLCMEVCEFSSPDEVAVCNLASVCLHRFVRPLADGGFDFETLHDVVKVVARNLDCVIDRNFYPIEKAERSNKRHRPIGVGVQGLADVFMKMRLPFESPEAAELNLRIFETMYHAAVEASVELAEEKGAYSTFAGSPASRGLFQFDLWGERPATDRYDWEALRARMIEKGLRNSLLIAPMPTASTSQIMGSNECFEPVTSNIYKRTTLAGEFIIVNNYLVDDLKALGLWDHDMKIRIMLGEGSVQDIPEIPADVREIYKTSWELKQKTLIDLAADRGRFVCQSQSMNLFVESPNFNKLSSMHFYSWKRGLKTGIYYLRTRAKAKAQQFTIDPKVAATVAAGKNKAATTAAAGPSCRLGDGSCEACSA